MEDVELIASAIALILWIPLCLLVGRAAGGYQHSSIGWSVLAFVFVTFPPQPVAHVCDVTD